MGAAGTPAPLEASQPITQGRYYSGTSKVLHEGQLLSVVHKVKYPKEYTNEYTSLFEHNKEKLKFLKD
jgi:hypothetical protein